MPITSDAAIKRLLQSARTIAIIGASDKSWRDSHDVMMYLLARGYVVYPVNPFLESIRGVRCYPDLSSVPEKIHIVDVFRKPTAVPLITEETISVKADALWLQLGVIHEESAKKAEEHGIQVIMDRCIAVEHRRLVH